MKSIVVFVCLLLALLPGPSMAGDEAYIDVIYDSIARSRPDGKKLSWGYASVISLGKEKFLVDFGKDHKILEGNMKAAGYSWSDFSSVILTVDEEGHRAGLEALKNAPESLRLYAPPDSENMVSRLVSRKNITYITEDILQISPELLAFKTPYNSKNVFHESVEEISLLMKTDKGIVLYVGCAIPGIKNIYKKAKEIFPGEPFFLMAGGFHLLRWENETQIAQFADFLKKDGLKNLAGGHCTGDLAFDIFKKVYAEHYMFCGIDAHITFGTPMPIEKESPGLLKKLLSVF